MWRALAPYLFVAALVVVAGATAYSVGGPAWIVYATTIVALVIVLPGYDRWDRRQHPR